MRDLKTEALRHIDREGDLVLFPAATPDVVDVALQLEQEGFIERNSVPGQWLLTEAGKKARDAVQQVKGH